MFNLESLVFKHDFKRPNQDLGCELTKHLGHLPGHIYMQNIKGVYLWCNTKQAQTLNYKKSSDVSNKTVFDILDEESAQVIFENDQEIIRYGLEKNFVESGCFSSGIEMQTISSKKAVLNPSGEIIGMIGISLEIPNNVPSLEPPLSTNVKDGMDFYWKNNVAHLAHREMQCLSFLIKGYSAKMIGEKLSISPKTAESYIKSSMNKLGVYNRPQLFSFLNTYYHVFQNIS